VQRWSTLWIWFYFWGAEQ